MKSQDRAPGAADPFEAVFGATPPSSAAPEALPTPSAGTADPFEAAFGPVGPDGRAVPSVTPPKASADLGGGSAFASGLISGVPVAGPFIKRNLDEGLAHLRSWGTGRSVEEERQAMGEMSKATEAAHPVMAGAGEITGQVGGYGLAAAAAPAAFGVGIALPEAAMMSGATNALISASDAYARGEDPVRAGEIGGGLGLAGPVIGGAVTRLFTNHIQPEVARLADLAINRFHIPLGPDLISTNPMVRFASSVMERMPFTGGQAAREARQTAFNHAVADQMGEDAGALTTDVMRRARTRIGGDFEYAARNTPQIGADQQFGNDLTRIWDDVTNPVDRALTADERDVVERNLRRVIELFNRGNGSITGQQYQQMTRQGTALYKAGESNNPNIRHYATEIRSALDAALQRFAPADAAERLTQARREWWAMKTVEDLAAKSPQGNISPALLKAKVDAHTHDMAYGGGGDLAELARIGDLFLKDAPSSGTAERHLIMKTVSEIASTGGLWALFGHPLAGAVGFGLPIAAGQISRIARSPRLGNALVQAATRGPGPVARGIRAGTRTIMPGLIQQARPFIENAYDPNARGAHVR